MKKTPAKTLPVEQKSVRSDSPVIIENKQALVPVNGFGLATGQRQGGRIAGRSSRSGGQKRKRGKVTPRLPPQINVILNVPSRIRYQISSSIAPNNATPVTRAMVLGSLGAICTVANTSLACWASTFRVKRITMWPAVNGDAGVLESVTGTAEQALVKEKLNISSLPTGITVDRAVVWAPPRGSYLRMWQSAVNSSDVLFYLFGNAGTILDVECIFTLAGTVGGSILVGAATCSLGHQYYLSLDGSTLHNITPLALNTTF